VTCAALVPFVCSVLPQLATMSKKVAYPSMKKYGYSNSLASASDLPQGGTWDIWVYFNSAVLLS